jgi:hypothetical protein
VQAGHVPNHQYADIPRHVAYPTDCQPGLSRSSVTGLYGQELTEAKDRGELGTDGGGKLNHQRTGLVIQDSLSISDQHHQGSGPSGLLAVQAGHVPTQQYTDISLARGLPYKGANQASVGQASPA